MALSPGTAWAGEVYNSRPYRQIVTVPHILEHEQVLQNIANANGGTRLAGTAGNLQTVDYIEKEPEIARRGVIALQIHGGEPAEASYKDIRIREL